MTQPVVGVLALQGGVAEHLAILESLGVRAVRVRSASDVLGDDGAAALASVPAVIVEAGNMRNAGDAAVLTDPAGRDRIAAAVAAAVLAQLRR